MEAIVRKQRPDLMIMSWGWIDSHTLCCDRQTVSDSEAHEGAGFRLDLLLPPGPWSRQVAPACLVDPQGCPLQGFDKRVPATRYRGPYTALSPTFGCALLYLAWWGYCP
mmetsp:Transcript_47594/g.85062  ORF Transcript_47594/g.85062 Transcript_47594/m.85062 type:complete len:109 (-) Transcript_47594:58-384(-)